MVRTSIAAIGQLNKKIRRKKFIPNREPIRARSFVK